MKESHKEDNQLKTEIAEINKLINVKERIQRLSHLMFEHALFKKMTYQDLAIQIKLHTHFEVSEDLLRQYNSKKPRSKTPSASRLKLIASVAKKISHSDELLEAIYESIETCKTEEDFEKNIRQANLLLTPIFERSIEFQKKYENKLEEAVRVLTDFQSEDEMIKLIQEIYATEHNKRMSMDSISFI